MNSWDAAGAEHDVLRRIAAEASAHAPAGWERIQIKIALASTFGEPDTAAMVDGEEKWMDTDFPLIKLLEELKQAMYRPGTGTWLSARLTISADGSVDASYNYDEEPEWDLEVARGIYAEELERFPRTPEHVPAWMAKDLTGASHMDDSPGVDSPYGVPYPGTWVRWQGEWYRDRSYSDEDMTLLLECEAPHAPGPGWTDDGPRGESLRAFSRLVRFAEVDEYLQFIVSARWRGYAYSPMLIDGSGIAHGWAAVERGQNVADLVAEIQASGHAGGSVEHRTVQLSVPARELTDFRLDRTRDLHAVLRKAGW